MGKEVKKKKKDEVLEENKVKNDSKKKLKNNKKEDKNKLNINKKLLVIISLLVIGFIVGLLFLVSYLNDVKKTRIAESEPIVSMLEDGTYYMMGASLDESFEVEVQDEFSYEVLDEGEKKVEVLEESREEKVIIKPLDAGWNEGATYTLKITNGKFTNSELSESSVVTFSTIRNSSQSHKYTKDVEVVSSENVKVNDNVIKTSKKLKVGEILVTEDSNNNPKAAYKITKVNSDGTYESEIPKLEEVFSKFDYYNMEYLDLSEIEVNSEFAAYLASVAKKSIIDSLALDVNAAAKVKVTYPKYNKKDKEVVFGVTLETEPGDKVFNKSFLKHHKLSTGYEVGIKVKAYENFYSVVRWDAGIEFEIRQTIKSAIETESETLKKIKNNFSELAADKTGINWLSDELYKVKKDDYGLDKKFGELSVESGIPGIQIVLTTNLLLDFDIKGNITTNLTNTTKASFGYSTEKEFYATASSKNKMTAEAMAEGKVRIGITAKAGIEVMNMVNLLGTGSVGLYGKGNISAKSEITQDKIKNTVKAKLEAGCFAEIGAEANIVGAKLKFKGWSKEWPKVTKTIPFVNETIIKVESASKEDKKEETKKDQDEKKEETPETPAVTPSVPNDVYYTLTFYTYNDCAGDLSGYPHVLTNMKVKAGKTFNEARVEHCNSGGSWFCPLDYSLDYEAISYHDSTVKDKAAQYRILKMEYNNWINSGECEDYWHYQENEYCYMKHDDYRARLEDLEIYLYHHDSVGNFNLNMPINSNIDLWIATGCGAA